MLKIKRFLGFTDGIKEPRKTKVENELSACYRYNGSLYNAVEFLCVKLLEGCYPDKQENYQYYKRNGELSKPKTLYKYYSEDTEHGKTYFELNKTQYDFVCYLIENGLNTEESILAYDKADVERVEALQRAEAEEKARQEEAKAKENAERERMKRIIAEESQYISEEEKAIVESVFLSIYGQSNNWNYSLVALIHNFDDKYCKEEIISRLHNDNKASIKIFECITGLKLPKSYKERKEYLEGLTKEDFQEMVQYKPRKKAEQTEEREVQKEEFYILLGNFTWNKVLAEPIKKYGIDMFIWCDNGTWKLSHAEVGMCITTGRNKTECMQKLKTTIDNKGIDAFNQLVENNKQNIFNRAGMNPRYNVA